jgi:cytochrome c553
MYPIKKSNAKGIAGVEMKKTLKWIGLILGSLVILLTISITALFLIGNTRISNAMVEIKPLVVTADEVSLARGEHLVTYVNACVSCHGTDFSGKIFLEEPIVGVLVAPNLTRGAGGVGVVYTVDDWDRAIRHGVGADGRVLGGMPSNHYAHLSDQDVAAIIAYLQNIPPVDNILPDRSLSLTGTVIFGALDFGNLPYSLIDHATVGKNQPVESISAEYGEYLVNIASCADCHASDLAGRSPDDSQPGPPAGPNLTSSGNIGNWTAAEFMTAVRAGRTPDGRQLNTDMPWRYYAGMTEDELEAIYLFLRQLP